MMRLHILKTFWWVQKRGFKKMFFLVQVRIIKNRKRAAQWRAEENQGIKHSRTEIETKRKSQHRIRKSDVYRQEKCQQWRTNWAAREKSCHC
jgi:hypothetical protein